MFQITPVEADFNGVKDYLERLAEDLENPKFNSAATEDIYWSVDWVTKEFLGSKNHPNAVDLREAAREVLRLLFQRWKDRGQVVDYIKEMRTTADETTRPQDKQEIDIIFEMMGDEIDFSDRPQGCKPPAKEASKRHG